MERFTALFTALGIFVSSLTSQPAMAGAGAFGLTLMLWMLDWGVERASPNTMTAAHRTLPFGTKVRVTNLNNGKKVVVRINDRGPFHEDRLIDLSYAAAVKLGYMERGTAQVEVEVLNIAGVDDRRGTTSGNYRYLQLGAFGSEASANALKLTNNLSIRTMEQPLIDPHRWAVDH